MPEREREIERWGKELLVVREGDKGREGEPGRWHALWEIAATYLLLYASSICTLSSSHFPSLGYINFTHFAQFSPFTMFSVFILINLSDSWKSYSASLLQILFIFMFVFICLFSPPSLSLLFQLLLSAIPTGAAPKNWRHVIDAFLMRILGHELNAIYCGNGKRERERGSRKSRGSAGEVQHFQTANLGQALVLLVVVAAFEKCNCAQSRKVESSL